MTGELTIREPTHGEIPRLVELLLHMDAHVSGAPRATLQMTPEGERQLRQRFASYIDNPYKLVLVACTARNRIVAMGDIALWHHAEVWETPQRQGQWYGVIDDLWVEPRYRRRGLTRRLVEGLVEFAASRGVEDLVLEYSLANREAEAVWTRLGFRPTGVRAGATVSTVRARLGREPQA